MAHTWRNLIILVMVLAALYFGFPYFSQFTSALKPVTVSETQSKILGLYQTHQIGFALNDFQLSAIKDSDLTQLLQSLQDYNRQLQALPESSNKSSALLLSEIYLLNAEKTQIRKILAQENLDLDNLPSNQICSNVSKFSQRQTTLEELFFKALELNQKIQSFEINNSSQANALSLQDLQSETGTLRNLIISSQERVNELKALCG